MGQRTERIKTVLLDEHKGKTVTGLLATLALTLATAIPGEYSPLPATRSYVDAKVAQATQGVPYLVKREAAKDVDPLWFSVACMKRYDLQGALDRALVDYKNQTGEAYQPKTCPELEAKREAKF